MCVPSGRYAHAFCIYPHSSPYERRDAVQVGAPIRGSPLVQIAPCREEPLLPLSRVRRTRSVVRMPSLHPRLTHGVEKSWRTYRRPQVGMGSATFPQENGSSAMGPGREHAEYSLNKSNCVKASTSVVLRGDKARDCHTYCIRSVHNVTLTVLISSGFAGFAREISREGAMGPDRTFEVLVYQIELWRTSL